MVPSIETEVSLALSRAVFGTQGPVCRSRMIFRFLDDGDPRKLSFFVGLVPIGIDWLFVLPRVRVIVLVVCVLTQIRTIILLLALGDSEPEIRLASRLPSQKPSEKVWIQCLC